jgi:hypothetical protein
MRKLNISNEKKRDAQVGFEGRIPKSTIQQVLPDNRSRNNVRFLKSNMETDLDLLILTHGNLDALAEAMISVDPEVDIEQVGRIVTGTRKLYLGSDNQIVYNLIEQEVVYNPDGTEKERRDFVPSDANISIDTPLRWTGKKIPKNKAAKMFVFSRKYQIRHVNGLTFDFLYDMAKQLDELNCMMLIGGGEKGNEPLIFSNGGVSYRGFLEGRIQDETYCLILHLSNLELKEIIQ